MRQVLLFVAVFTTLTALVHYYFWARLVRDAGLSGRVAIAMTVLIALAALSLPLGFVLGRSSAFSWWPVVWMGISFFLLITLAFGDLYKLVAGLLASGPDVPADPARRGFMARSTAQVAAVATAGLSGASLYFALRPVGIKKVAVKLKRLPAAFEGLRVVQFTDVHIGPTIRRDFAERIVALANSTDPDIVAITGDLVDGSVEALRDHVAPLKNLRAKHGVFFVTGNHEYYSGADEWIAHLETLGVKVLRNERVSITRDGETIDVVGIDDFRARGPGHGPDLPRALEAGDAGRFRILLAHQPKAIHDAAAHDIALQISGHTHGGQIFPFGLFVKLDQPYVSGLHTHLETDTQIYVSEGTGYWGPPMRLGTAAEVTQLDLSRA